MFKTSTKTFTNSWQRELGYAVCDRCGHVMNEADSSSGYHNLTLLRFRAGYDSQFGDGQLIEGDFCDACLYALVARYVRVVEDDHVPDSADFFRVDTPRRLYAESQLAYAMAEGLLGTMQGWVKRAFVAERPRRPLLDSGGTAGATEDKPADG
ncbi:MAG: hypothetical protein ACREPL_07720 [Rhodanobacteraceae bacterium]